MTQFVVGVDGGTTKTIALVADLEGHIVASARGAGSNWVGADVTQPMTTVANTVKCALQEADLDGQAVIVAVLGLAGADWPEDHERRQAFLSRSNIAQRVIVKNDSFVGLRVGIRRPYGMVIVAGTGTNTAVIAPDGREWAFGYYVDRGGAGDTGREVMRAVLHEQDGRGRATSLTPAVLAKLGYPGVEAMLRAMLVMDGEDKQTKDYLSLCPLAFEAAEAGDAVATELVVQQGLGLAEYATTLARRFHMQDIEFDLVLSGSVFKAQGPLLIQTITQAIHRVAPLAHIVRPSFEPAVGGLLLAYDALGLPVSDGMYRNLSRTVPESAFFSTIDGGAGSFRIPGR